MNDAVVARARDGDGAAFEAIWRDLAAPVAGYLRARGVPEVEDLVSDVFLAVFRGLPRFRGDGPALRSWVFTIAHHRAVDATRAWVRRPAQDSYDPQTDGRRAPSAEACALDVLATDETVGLLAVLSADQREVLVLRLVCDLTVDQVARVTGRSPGGVKQLQRRGLATLRRHLSDKADIANRRGPRPVPLDGDGSMAGTP